PIPGGRGSSLYPACQNMMLAAHAEGVSSLFTTFFGLVEREVKALLHVPARMFLEACVFLGYGAEPLGKPRRKPLSEVAHLGACAGFDPDEVQVVPITYDEMRPGCFEQRARLADMDLNWVDASLCFPTFPRFCGQTFLEARDKDLALLCVRAYNDWMVDEWCA